MKVNEIVHPTSNLKFSERNQDQTRNYCLLPRPFFDCCCSACSFPETSLISASGPRVMRAKKMLSFSIFFAS
uniref:Uncharacterized protein n=1 Tax=Arundo donax TaxID=35708 RepID=A0A0A9G3Z2_ARUDO